MPPKKKTTSSIASAFKPSSSKSGSTAVQQGKLNASRSASLDKVKGSTPSASTVAVTSRSPSPDKASSLSRSQSGTAAVGGGAQLSKEEIAEAEKLPHLDVNARDLNGIWNEVKKEKLGKVGAIHAQGQNRIHHILRSFDFDPSYGPCLGLTRLERWNRAKDLGEDPPVEVWEILNTREGKLDEEYRESCLIGAGI